MGQSINNYMPNSVKDMRYTRFKRSLNSHLSKKRLHDFETRCEKRF